MLEKRLIILYFIFDLANVFSRFPSVLTSCICLENVVCKTMIYLIHN